MNENQAILAAAMSEADLTDAIVAMAHMLGWLVDGSAFRDRAVGFAASRGRYDCLPSPGFPDLILVHREWQRLIVAELKTETGVVTADQREWLDRLKAVFDYATEYDYEAMDVVVWRPSDWHSGEIERTLRGEG